MVSASLDFELLWQHMRFELECLKRVGAAFQYLFEDIMTKADESFQTVKPWGKDGDEKCDGISAATGTYYQVYAPEGISAATTINKIAEDFSGAKDNWPRLKVWIFVWSAVAQGLPPKVIQKLQELDEVNPDVDIDDWSRADLWLIVAGLTPQQRAELFGAVPQSSAATATTAVEVRTVLNWLAAQPVGPKGRSSTHARM